MNTDQEWERWGQQDPYFGVLTDPKFRSANITEEARKEFFDSGRHHVQCVFDSCAHWLGVRELPARVLEFGCGVGRLVAGFAERAQLVVGVDVSPSMLAEAARNCQAFGVRNVQLLRSDDELAGLWGQFDLVHSAIVLQHIEVARGRKIFKRLIELMAPGGVAAVQLTYAKAYHPDTFGQVPEPPPAPPETRSNLRALLPNALREPAPAPPANQDPLILMNPYNLNEIAYLMQSSGIQRFGTEFTDHGGELGVFLYFQKPAA